MARAVRVYCMYGLGGPIWSGGIENVLAANLRKIKGVICPPTFRYGQWQLIADAIKNTPGDIHVVIGHSMGAAAATYVTDHVKVDLLVLYDLAGMSPSKLGKNTGKCIDIYDVIPDLVPEWRVQAVKGHEHKIERWTSTYGHTGQDDSEALMRRVGAVITQLAA
jgi:pimeloyl-ACP methyl ester carboxylesterase